MSRANRRGIPTNNKLYGDIDGCLERYDTSRGAFYQVLAKLQAEGKTPAVKDGRRTKIVLSVTDEYYASLPPARFKPAADDASRPAPPWIQQPATPPATTAPAAPESRRRGRPRKSASAALPPVATPPMAPADSTRASE